MLRRFSVGNISDRALSITCFGFCVLISLSLRVAFHEQQILPFYTWEIFSAIGSANKMNIDVRVESLEGGRPHYLLDPNFPKSTGRHHAWSMAITLGYAITDGDTEKVEPLAAQIQQRLKLAGLRPVSLVRHFGSSAVNSSCRTRMDSLEGEVIYVFR